MPVADPEDLLEVKGTSVARGGVDGNDKLKLDGADLDHATLAETSVTSRPGTDSRSVSDSGSSIT